MSRSRFLKTLAGAALGISLLGACSAESLTEFGIERALEAGLTVHSPVEDERRTGFVAVNFETSEAASKALIAERYKLDWRPNCGLRIGPHFYSTEDEVERMMKRIVELAAV